MKAEITTESDDQQAAATNSEDRPKAVSDGPPEAEHENDFRRLDTRWIGLARLINAITFALIGAVVLAVGSGLLSVLPHPWTLLVPVVWIAIGGLCALSVVWWPRWEYGRWSYRLGRKVLELRFGVIWQVTVAIPVSRLQHVDLHRGPLERRRGLASLQIHTAGTRDATHTVPGLDFAMAGELRDQLIEAANRGSHERQHD